MFRKSASVGEDVVLPAPVASKAVGSLHPAGAAGSSEAFGFCTPGGGGVCVCVSKGTLILKVFSRKGRFQLAVFSQAP